MTTMVGVIQYLDMGGQPPWGTWFYALRGVVKNVG